MLSLRPDVMPAAVRSSSRAEHHVYHPACHDCAYHEHIMGALLVAVNVWGIPSLGIGSGLCAECHLAGVVIV